MFECYYTIDLRIMHPIMHPKDISNILGLSPDIQRSSGEMVLGTHGESLGRKSKVSYWSCDLLGKGNRQYSGSISVSDSISAWVAKLSQHEEFFKKVRKEEGRAGLSVAWYSESNNSTELLDSEMLEACGRLGLDLEFDVYFVPEQKTPILQEGIKP